MRVYVWDSHNLTDATREVVKGSTEDVKTLAGWVIRPEDVRPPPSLHASPLTQGV